MNIMERIPLSRMDDLTPLIAEGRNGAKSLTLYVDGIHCAGCVNKIERKLSGVSGLEAGRVNFSTHQLQLNWKNQTFKPKNAIKAIEELGFNLIPTPAISLDDEKKKADRKLLIAMAVAGFATANIMLLSFAVWSGNFTDMGGNTRTFFHWLTALIALPAIVFSGRPFFGSALRALKARSLNMDVPISVAVVLASGMSLYETSVGGPHAYFDAAVMLLFFLLVGRYLDSMARAKAHSVGALFLALQTKFANLVKPDGTFKTVPVQEVSNGALVLVRPGEKIPVDGVMTQGQSDIDTSLITGESLPRQVMPGDKVFAGTVNLTGTLYLKVEAAGEETLISKITRLMEAAEQSKSKFVRWADEAARIYAPVVHIFGLLAFLGWWFIGGLEWQGALTIAISVLIITCPCALGIAVPAVQVVAIGRLLKAGIIVKSGDVLERLSNLKAVVFDKTGTLTKGTPELINRGKIDKKSLTIASAIAGASQHPLSLALRALCPDVPVAKNITETPGAGLEAKIKGKTFRLGSRKWCGIKAGKGVKNGTELWLVGAKTPVQFLFQDELKDDAAAVVRDLRTNGFQVFLLSGDRAGVVKGVAEKLGQISWFGDQTPKDKINVLKDIQNRYGRVLMVGDGLNDSPALVQAEVSMSPTSAVDISQNAADIVFQGDRLAPVKTAIRVSGVTRKLVMQNFFLAVLYNIIAIPIAVAGFATPLVAAIAMSSSSVLVTLNALRAGRE